MKKFILATIILGTAFTACVDPAIEQKKIDEAVQKEVAKKMKEEKEKEMEMKYRCASPGVVNPYDHHGY
jgi:hypothetical protein